MSDSLEINSNNSISIIDNDAIVLATNNAIDIKYSEPEYDVTVNKKEYIITGDTLYIPKRYEDAPQWLRDIIANVTDVALSAKISDINNLTQSLNNLIDELNVAKNTYTMSIISSNDINERINTAVETLNSSMMESDATILGLATTKVTPEQAQAISIDAIRTSLNDTTSGNSLGSIISEMQSTTTTGDYTNAQSIEVLQSTIEGNADSTATAIDTINTFAGIDETGAYTYTGLTGYLVDPNTGMIGGGQSELQNTITTTGDNVEAKFEYGSNIKIGGQYHNAGFGLKTTMTGGDGTIADPYNSEFWINAEKFKFTNNSMSGQATPFSIDATGLQPKITFNGLVTFGSGQTGTIEEAISSTIETIQVGDKNINISDNLIPTTSLVSDTNNAGYQFVGDVVKAMQTGVSTFAEAQITLTSGSEVYSPYVDEITVPYYYRFGIKGLVDNADLSKFKIVTVDSSNVVTYSTVTVTISETLVSTEWYEIDGIINPVGGDAAVASGSIRKSDGTKIGTVNNFALPSGSVKLLLGWHGECIISRMKLAKITADTLTSNYVSYDYVDESLDNKVGLATLKDIAVKLGYLSYEDLAFKASLGQTIVVGGYLRTGLIEASAITSDLIDAYAIAGKYITGGTINGTKINGTEINGAVINGAVINGAVIKASYLDLDGAIQVLTNYHLCITQAKLNAVIAIGGTGQLYTNSTLMPDAIPINIPDPVTGIDVIDEYRIPSLSVLNWNGGSASTTGTSSASLNTRLYAYNVSNAGVNTKAVKIRPIMSIHGITMKTGVYGIGDLSAPDSVAHCIMYFGNIQLCKLRLWTYPQESGAPIRFTIERYGQSSLNGVDAQLDGTTFNILGVSFSVSSYVFDYPHDMNDNSTGRDVETTITVTKAIGELGFDFLSGSIRFDVYAKKPINSNCMASVSSTGISINNMV